MNKEQKTPITEDLKRLCDICHDLGYIGSLADEHYHDSRGSDKADRVCEYITELFNAKRKERTMSDLIRREDAINVFIDWGMKEFGFHDLNRNERFIDALSALPSAEATGALDDAIAKYVADGLMELPSAEARPTGEWVQKDMCADRFCSKCNYAVWDSEAEEYNFCPNCGAEMTKGGDDE